MNNNDLDKVMALPSPEYELSAHPKAFRIFTLVMAVLSIIIKGVASY
jgi:hypothetical protein